MCLNRQIRSNTDFTEADKLNETLELRAINGEMTEI